MGAADKSHLGEVPESLLSIRYPQDQHGACFLLSACRLYTAAGHHHLGALDF